MQAMRERKEKKASEVKSPQREHQPSLPQEHECLAAGFSDASKAAVAVGTDNKKVFPSRHLDVPALYDTQVRIRTGASSNEHFNPIFTPQSWSLEPMLSWSMILPAFPPFLIISPTNSRPNYSQATADNALDMLDNIELLNYDDRLLIADDLRKKLEAFLADSPSSNPLKDTLRARMQTSPLKEELAMLAIRGLECRQAAEDLAGTENWTLVMRSFGFETFVRPMGGQMLVKVSGEQEGTSVFDQLVVVREAAMYHRYVIAVVSVLTGGRSAVLSACWHSHTLPCPT